MAKAIVQSFEYETDSLTEFETMMKTALKILFSAGRNTDPEFHNMYCHFGASPRYWMLEEDSKEDGPKRIPAVVLSHHLGKNHKLDSNEIMVPMKFTEESEKLSKEKWDNYLIWDEDSYQKLFDIIMKSVKEETDESLSIKNPVTGWIKEETTRGDGSKGLNYKMKFVESSPGALYISLGWTYYSK